MDDSLESLYILILLLLVIWSLSFVIRMMFQSDLLMVLFFWISTIAIVTIYSFWYKKKHIDITGLKKQILLSIPIWLFLIYQSYFTLKNAEMTPLERWALIPFVLGLSFYLTILKIFLDKDTNNAKIV